jgi:hypothetical protein
MAWEAPARPRKRAISSSEKPNPPFSTDVYQKTGATIIFVRYMNRCMGRTVTYQRCRQRQEAWCVHRCRSQEPHREM